MLQRYSAWRELLDSRCILVRERLLVFVSALSFLHGPHIIITSRDSLAMGWVEVYTLWSQTGTQRRMRCLMLLGAICICESRHCCFAKLEALVTDPIIAIGAHLTILVSRNVP